MGESKLRDFDVFALQTLRKKVESVMARVARENVCSGEPQLLLDAVPRYHAGAGHLFSESIVIGALGIDPNSGATQVKYLCESAALVGHKHYDYVACTEILEHRLNYFAASNNITEMRMPRALVFVSTTYNYRVHGPLSDCLRFAEHGLRDLFKGFVIFELGVLETENRFLMPNQYTLAARKPPRGTEFPGQAC